MDHVGWRGGRARPWDPEIEGEALQVSVVLRPGIEMMPDAWAILGMTSWRGAGGAARGGGCCCLQMSAMVLGLGNKVTA